MLDCLYLIMIYIPIWLDLLCLLLIGLLLSNCHLHSNMVRFIIKMETIKYRENATIYIPIWLDLLLIILSSCSTLQLDLHSNMVRFIMFTLNRSSPFQLPFTFQYGQIYYFYLEHIIVPHIRIYIPIWLDLLFAKNKKE